MSYRYKRSFKNERLDADDIESERELPLATTKDIVPKCPTGKVVWTTASKAACAARDHRRRHKDPFIESYACKKCGFWHVGHQIGTQKRRDEMAKSQSGGHAA